MRPMPLVHSFGKRTSTGCPSRSARAYPNNSSICRLTSTTRPCSSTITIPSGAASTSAEAITSSTSSPPALRSSRSPMVRSVIIGHRGANRAIPAGPQHPRLCSSTDPAPCGRRREVEEPRQGLGPKSDDTDNAIMPPPARVDNANHRHSLFETMFVPGKPGHPVDRPDGHAPVKSTL